MVVAGILLATLAASCKVTPKNDSKPSDTSRKSGQEVSKYINLAVSWLIAEYGRNYISTQEYRPSGTNGPIVGRWIVDQTKTDFRLTKDGLIAVYLIGKGYAGNTTHWAGGTVYYSASLRTTYRAKVEVKGNEAVVRLTHVGPASVIVNTSAIATYNAANAKPEHIKLANDTIRRVFEQRLKDPFEISINRVVEEKIKARRGQQKSVGQIELGTTVTLLPTQQIQVHEDGIDLVGPFQVYQGDKVKTSVTTASPWRMDVYLLEDADARSLLAYYVESGGTFRTTIKRPDVTPMATKENTLAWDLDWTSRKDRVFWILIDNTNSGSAHPYNLNGKDDVLDVDVFVSKTR